MAVVLVVLLGVAAMSVDLIHAYVEAQHAQNAADSAALAGVVSLPNDHFAANASARNLAKDNGYEDDGGVTTKVTPLPAPGGVANEMQVEISRTFDTFFARAIGFPTMTVTKSSIAEYDPPVQLGSPLNTFGNQPGSPGAQPKLWASVSGPLNSKHSGNAAMSEWCDAGDGPALPGRPNIQTDNCQNASNNRDYETAQVRATPAPQDPVAYFNIDTAGGMPTVEVFDGPYVNVSTRCDVGSFTAWMAANHAPDPANGSRRFSSGTGGGDWCTGDTDIRWDIASIPGNHLKGSDPNNVFCPPPNTTNKDFWPGMARCQYDDAIENNGVAVKTTFELFAPDLTPNNPVDNADHSPVLCTKKFEGYANIDKAVLHDPSLTGWREWRTACTGAAGGPGRYVLRVSTQDGTEGQNSFALRATDGGSVTPTLAPATRMAIFTNESTAHGTFHLARVLPSTVDRVLQVQLFDVADFTGGGGSVTVKVVPQASTERLQPPSAPAFFGDLTGCKYTPPLGKAFTATKPWDAKAEAWGVPVSTAPDCSFNAPSGIYNGQWVTIEVPIPKEYSCDALDRNACWLLIDFQAAGGSITDITTWTARFPGNPVRIVK